MDSTHFQLVFDGEVEPGHDPQEVRHKLADLFGLDEACRAEMLLGNPIVLSKGMDAATAGSFRKILTAAGAVSQVVADGESAAPGETREQRSAQRRSHVSRRDRTRDSSILPDRRHAPDRRK